MSGGIPKGLSPVHGRSEVEANGNGHSNGNGHLNGKSNGNGHRNSETLPSLSWCQPAKLVQTEGAGARPYILLPVSAHDERALKENLAAVSSSLTKYELADLLYTLSCRKSTFARRAFAIAESEATADELNPDLVTIGKAPSSATQRIGFVFTGQGAQWPQSTYKTSNYSIAHC